MLALPFVFRILAPKELAIAQAVCKEWHEVASLPDIIQDVFVQQWCLSSVSELPPKWALAATCQSFVQQHFMSRSDSLASLAIRFNLPTGAIKRANNLVSECLASRTHLFLPVSGPEQIVGKHASFLRCPVARKLYVVLSACKGSEDHPNQSADLTRLASPAPAKAKVRPEALEEKLVGLLSRSQCVDEATASYYLKDADGDFREAVRMLQEDRMWSEGDPCTCFGRLKVH